MPTGCDRFGAGGAIEHRRDGAYDLFIVRRTQIYLEEEHVRQLARLAIAAGVTKSSLIRDAIDAFLAGSDEDQRLVRFRRAVSEASGSPGAADLPPGRDYVEALRGADWSREDALEERRRS